MIALSEMEEGDPHDPGSLSAFAHEAEQYLRGQRWCGTIREGFLNLGWEGILGVFLFRFIPSEPEVDDSVWVIAGDVPPAHICNDSPNGASALFAYVWEMQRWVDAARAGRAVDALIPVNVPPTVEWAGHVGRRLDFIRKRLLVEYEREIVWDIGRYNELVEREDRSDKG